MSERTPRKLSADANRSIDSLATPAIWNDEIYRNYVRQSIEAGIADADNNDVVDVNEVRRQFGLAP